MQYAFHFDASRCAQCFACEVACKSAHQLAPAVQAEPGTCGPRFRQVVNAYAEGTDHPITYISMACMHCAKPDCMRVCPAKAISREPKFGAVVVDQKKCLGCRYCSWACEFGAPQFGADGLMQKCNMCVERLEKGELPACVQNCCGGALTVAPVEEVGAKTRSAAAKRLAGNSMPNYVMVR